MTTPRVPAGTHDHEKQLMVFIRRCFLALIALPGLYVLGYGPLCSLTARGWITPNTYYSYSQFMPMAARRMYLLVWIRVDTRVADTFKGGGY